ncbi:sulfite exporter TauE/SafE family protein [Streptomyces marincola]|uniref:Probable membrane transporter protein n=1 Tax=Streptomyces marincola TaxID=2878388 RepID=A0A1W7CZH2_9ACTN|nr:sulfite exporter TauE/SafE family protein [Streptomyces marincola]ARQ70117.1 sulfite transporter TauE/SafE [Streptomyces marincola]
MPDISFLLLTGAAVFFGAAVQSGVGLGLGLVAAPVVAFTAPSLMPGALIVTTTLLPVLTIAAEWRHIHWRGLAWGLPARLPGSLAGAWLVGVLAPETLAAVVGAMVLLAVAATLSTVRLPLTPVTLVAAGVLSGAGATTTSIGGPPLALLYQHEEAARVRATLGGFFLVGAAMSLGVLAASGELTGEQVRAGLAMLPFVAAGFLAGRPLRRRFGTEGLRAALLWVVGLSGAGLLARALL